MPEDKGLTRSQREEKVLQFWKENKIFEKTLEKKSPKGNFVFYEGPPTANGKPGIHHLESRAFKDAIPRYKTMRGFHVPRKAGWDTHGLPVELEVEKKIGSKSKKDIEAYGIARFNEECRKSVLAYIDEWSRFTERIGYWVNLNDAYFTYDNSYIESVWKVISHVEKRKLLYKDYKVVPWCPRCGTALSSHELAQGYQDVKDLSLYVKFKLIGFPNAYFLAWTTTPWTLPGNLALAVGPDITYVEAKVGDEIYVLAKNRLSILTEPYEIVAEHKGSEMVGMAYEPIYNFIKPTEKTFKVYSADFVTTEDGTGIVHTAVMYGQEDFELGTKIGLPKQHLVDDTGHFKQDAGFLVGKSVIEESTAVEILKDLQSRGLLFKKESYTHSYPFCWRCKTRLIYYARDSWYIRMSSLRSELVKENEKINWEPDHIKEGRFGEWLREVKDWAISRERYWGTPLPVWESEDKNTIVVDSVDTLQKYTKTSGNKYFVMRHGEAVFNAKHVLDPQGDPNNHLTEKGKEEVRIAAERLRSENINVIYASPFIRTQETAEILKAELAISEVVIDERLHEFNESDELSVRRRVGELLFELERSKTGKNILIISHGNPIWALERVASINTTDDFAERVMFQTGEVRTLSFISFPHNSNFELDLHKPYIDEVVLVKDGKEYRRSKDVMDVWLDSGSMPFASFDSAQDRQYPADYISEAIDQTRGWFYTLHAVGTLMGQGRAFKNVICLGHILDNEGKKMSKSVGNIVEPWAEIEKYGVDTLRLWMYSVNQPGESKNFDQRSVDEVQKRVFNLLDNVWAFYELYRDKSLESNTAPNSKNILDKWILARQKELVGNATKNLERYKLLEPVRDIRDFINDLSTWYLRRSRDRLKQGDKDAKQTLYYVLKNTCKLLAPFAPFAADELYQKLRIESDPLSVHLESWPEKIGTKTFFFQNNDDIVMSNMESTRRIVSLALEARSKANIKIRQPLASLTANLDGAYPDLIKEEVNIKEVKNEKKLDGVILDTSLTPELIEEGRVREVIRNIQEMRKEKGLRPSDRMAFDIPAEESNFYTKHKKIIESATNTTLVSQL